MQTDLESPFELLEPPQGGIERMAARLAAPELVRSGFGLAGAGVATLAALVALLVVVANEMHGRDARDGAILASHELDRLLGREARPPPLTVERDGQAVQTEQMPSADPRVRIYQML